MADRGKPLTAEILARYRRMIAAGKTKAEIARATGTSRPSVIKYAKRLHPPIPLIFIAESLL